MDLKSWDQKGSPSAFPAEKSQMAGGNKASIGSIFQQDAPFSRREFQHGNRAARPRDVA